MRLDVLVYNIEYGGDESTDAVIEELDADVVGLLESYKRLPEIAEVTGYPYYDISLQILSKHPIHEPSGAEGRYALIEVRPGEVIAFFNIHLDYVAYGPRLIRDGTPVAEVIASENRVRTSVLEAPLGMMEELLAHGYPVILTGDHNEPSSLDWTSEAVGRVPGISRPVRWPVSEAILDAGLRDTYREVHSDPVQDPGVTHPPTGDRIDFLYAGGPVRTLDSRLVGDEGGRGVDVGFDRWTSDHHAVLSTVEVEPRPMPVMVSVDEALLTQGDPLTVAYRAPEPDARVLVRRSDATAPALARSFDRASGRLEVDTSTLAPGGYEAVLLDREGAELERVRFWLRDPKATIRLTTDQRSYKVGEPIVLRWTAGPANRWDWIGIYEAGRSNPKVHYYLLWRYTDGHASGTVPPSPSGSMTMDGSAQGGPWPLPPGRYVAHYLVVDRYLSIGQTEFEVAGPSDR